ncbi:glycine cleavage system protein GcvH [Streptomyces naphthomycinicus]|uniref:glycine cleavage system protein GcvH n=1 Tax=Streptomyces naphthomycinicus TaxID=2872625 RepID=UPI001CEC8F33|nr:glycine cleavage system protein GcvH [Streptomyces sp. TML10]
MATPEDLKYTKDHEWVRVAGDKAYVGITDHAQKQLGDVVFVELPETGARFDASDPFGTVESVKAVTEVYMPLSGSVAEVNAALDDEPELVNTEPYGDGWMIGITLTDKRQLDGLLTAAEYEEYITAESE